MKARPRPPLRLSVEERVDHAVSGAVRRALAEQRKTQEEELDSLSDVLQRSLAALAGERDRALRSLAAEEDRRRDMIEDLTGLVGDELSCGDVSRLAMGLERIEREGGAAAEQDDGEPRGRAWVLEQLRQCLYARAAVQDYLRSSADEIAASMFEAEEGLIGFELGPGGGQDAQNASPISCPPAADAGDGGQGGALWSAGSEKVAQARAAASDALGTSLRLARERVDFLHALVLEVKGGEGRQSAAVSQTAVLRRPGKRAERAGEGYVKEFADVAKGTQPLHDDGGGGGDGGDGDRGDAGAVDGGSARGARGSSGRSESSRSRDQEGSARVDAAEGATLGRPAEAVGLGVDGGDGACAEKIPEELACTVMTTERVDEMDEHGRRQVEEESRGDQNAPARTASSGSGDGSLGSVEPDERRRPSRGVGDGSEHADDGLAARPLTRDSGAVQLPDSELAEVAQWKMAARRSEASLADLRETLGDVLALTFKCGEESALRRWEGEEKEGEAGNGGDPGRVPGGAAGNAGVGDAAAGAAAAAAAESGVSEGSVGTCGRPGRSSSYEAKATAVEVILKRLEALFADQGDDIARLEASLQLLRRSGAQSEAAAASEDRRPSSGVSGSAVSGRDGLGGSAREESAAAADALNAEGMPSRSLPSSATATADAPRVEAGRELGVAKGQGLGGGRGSRDASPKRDIRTEWEELDGLETYLPYYQGGGGLGSQAIQDVLDRWIDVSKRNILEGWLGHVLHGGPVDSANGNFVPRVQMSSLSKEVRDGMVSVVLPLLLGRRGVLLQVLTRERVELVHDIQIRVTPVAGRREAPLNNARTAIGRGGNWRRPPPPVGEREHGARIRDMVMKAAHVGYVEEDEGGGGDGAAAWRTPLASVDSLSRQLKDTWETFNANFAAMGGELSRAGASADGAGRGVGGDRGVSRGPHMLPEY